MVVEYEEIVTRVTGVLPENTILSSLSSRVNRLSVSIPMIKHLRNPNLNAEHWQEINKKIGFKLSLSSSMSLNEFINLKLDQFKDCIYEITNTADVETSLQLKFKDIEARWKEQPIKAQLYKSKNKNNKEVYHFLEVEETTEALDRLLVDILMVASNQCCKPIRAKVNELEKTLKYANICFEEWVKMQEEWMYLDNLFSSIDNKKVYENTVFEAADKGVKALMKTAYKSKNCYRMLGPANTHL